MPKRPLAAALAAYTIVVVSGAPLPLAVLSSWCLRAPSEGTTAERFPCEACPCGCGTAEHCWNDCCCHTLPQRLTWARREGVRPPESALDSADRASLDTSEWRKPSKRRVVVPIEETHLADLPPCCRKARLAASCRETPTGSQQKPNGDPRANPGVALLSAMACQGLAEAWMSLGLAPLAAPPELVEPTVPAVASESPAPLWRTRTEAPKPPPPDRLV